MLQQLLQDQNGLQQWLQQQQQMRLAEYKAQMQQWYQMMILEAQETTDNVNAMYLKNFVTMTAQFQKAETAQQAAAA